MKTLLENNLKNLKEILKSIFATEREKQWLKKAAAAIKAPIPTIKLVKTPIHINTNS